MRRGVAGEVMGIEYLRPDGSIEVTGWSDQTGDTVDIHAMLDEATASDTDFVQSEVIVADGANLVVRLFQGSTQIAEWTHTDVGETFATAEQTLTAPQLAAITDFSNLFIELGDGTGYVYRMSLGNPTGPLAAPVVVRYRYKKLIEEEEPPGDLEVIDPANLAGGAEDFSGAPWGVVCTVTPDDTADPNGNMNADRCVAGAMGFSGCYQGFDYVVAAYRMTCRFKRINWDFVCLDFVNGGWGATFDLNLGTVSFESPEVIPGSTTMVALSDGWYRCSIERDLTALNQYPEWYFSGEGTSLNRPRNMGAPRSTMRCLRGATRSSSFRCAGGQRRLVVLPHSAWTG